MGGKELRSWSYTTAEFQIPLEKGLCPLVLPSAGDGKSHFIEGHMAKNCQSSTCIPVHEGFTPAKAIEILRTLECDMTSENGVLGVHFNITVCPPWVRFVTCLLVAWCDVVVFTTEYASQCLKDPSTQCKLKNKELFDTLGWFFFDFLLLGYVEDPHTGLSFRMPPGFSWNLYLEVIELFTGMCVCMMAFCATWHHLLGTCLHRS